MMLNHYLSFTIVLLFSASWGLPAASKVTTYWKELAGIGLGPRQEHAVTAINETLYVIAGTAVNECGNLTTITRVETFNAAKEKWAVVAPLPIPMNHPNAAAVAGKVYVLGGLDGGANWNAIPNSYFYSPFNDTWTELTPQPKGTWRGSSAMGVLGSTIYLAGGMTLLQPTEYGVQKSVATVTSYNTLTGKWNTSYPPLPAPRDHVGGAVVGSTFYVLGGRDDGVFNVRNTVYALDLLNPIEWREKARMPTARGSISAAAVGNRIYTFGGEGNKADIDKIFNNTEVYDVTTDSWKELAPMVHPRHGTGAATINSAVHVPGGGARTGTLPISINDALVEG